MHSVPLKILKLMTIELGTAEKENFQTPRAALAQHPRTTSLPTATCLHEDLPSMADWWRVYPGVARHFIQGCHFRIQVHSTIHELVTWGPWYVPFWTEFHQYIELKYTEGRKWSNTWLSSCPEAEHCQLQVSTSDALKITMYKPFKRF